MNLNHTNNTRSLANRLTNLQLNKKSLIATNSKNLIKIIEILRSQKNLAPLKIAHFLMGKIKLEDITNLDHSKQEQIKNLDQHLVQEHSSFFSHGSYIRNDVANILKSDILKSGEYFGSLTEDSPKTTEKLDLLLTDLKQFNPVVQESSNRNSLVSNYQSIANNQSFLFQKIENSSIISQSKYESFIASDKPQDIEHEIIIASDKPQDIEHEIIMESNKISIKGNLINNVTISEYNHDEHILKTVTDKSLLYKGHIYEIKDSTEKIIYTGPLKLNDNQIEPCIPRQKFKLLTNLGTSIGAHQDASVLCNVHKRVHLDQNNKLLIEGLGSSLKNPLVRLGGQIMAYGIDEKIQQGVDFMEDADFVFGSGFSRGGIQLAAQVNSSTNKLAGAKKIHIFGLDPVAGGGFGIAQTISTLGGLLDGDNHDEDTETLNEQNIVGGMVTYSKETNVAFDPKVYTGQNYKTFVAHANHQNIDGAEASRKNIPGITRLKRERQMHIGDVMQSLEEKQLLLYGFGIFDPTYLIKETELQYLNDDYDPKNTPIVNTSVMPLASIVGRFTNDRPILLQNVLPLSDLYT
jgi:hypothetical protein